MRSRVPAWLAVVAVLVLAGCAATRHQPPHHQQVGTPGCGESPVGQRGEGLCLATGGPIAVAATGPSDVWMFTATDRFPDHYGVRHWNGRSWTTSTLRPTCECRPLAGSGIAAVAPDDVWAVVHRPATGSQYWHSERGTWRGYPPAGQDGRHPLQISAIAGSGPNDVWAAGMDPATTTGVLQHWDGTSWRSVADPDLADHLVVGLAVPAPGDVWLVVVGSHGTELPEYQHHTSAGWQRLPGPLRAAEQLDQLVVTGDQDAYASVEHTGGGQPALRHWNGRDWQPVTLPAGTFTGQVAADGAGGVWLATNGKTTVDETGPRTTPTALLHLAQGTVTALPGPRPALTGHPPRYDTTVLGPPWPDEITTTLLGVVPHTTTVWYTQRHELTGLGWDPEYTDEDRYPSITTIAVRMS